MTRAASSAQLSAGVEEVRAAFVELMGAERRLRGRDSHRKGGMTQGQIRALFQLADEGEMTAGEIAKGAGLTPASVTALLDQMEADGMVQRRRAEHDRRVVVVSLTDRGKDVLATKREHFRARVREALSELSDGQLAAGADVMRRLARMFDEL